MPPSSLALLVALLAPAGVDVAAERLEAGADGWSATGLRLELGPTRLEAASGRSQPTAQCPRDRVTLTDVRLTRGALRGTAGAARLCLLDDGIGPLEVDGLTLEGPRLRARAAAARWREAAVEVDDVWLSPCGCADPPWAVTADHATMTPGEGAWLTWPVLRAGGVPVLAAPVAYVPLARRRTGFLAPRLGWDAVDGPHGALPFFWAPVDALDLTLAPGWRDGLTVDGRLRWAATPDEGGEVEAWTAPLDGEAVVVGQGSLPAGPVRVAVDGEWAESGDSWRRRRPGYVDRGRRHLHADVGVAAVADDLGLGLRLSRLERLPGGVADGGEAVTTPSAWLRLGAGVGPLRLTLDGAALQALRPGPDGEVFDLALAAEAREWVGPLAVRPVVAGRTRIHPATDTQAAEQSLAAMAGVELEAALRRRYARAVHRVALTLDGRWATASAVVERALDHADRPLDARDLGVTLSTDMMGRRWSGRLSARAGYDGLTRGAAPVWVRGRLDGPWLGLGVDGAADGALDARGLWIDGRLGPADGPRLRVGGAWARVGPALPWLRPVGLVLPTQAVPLVTGDTVGGCTVGLTAPIGPLTAAWSAAVALAPDAPAALVGQIGTLDWRGRCDCWSAGLWLGHEAGRSTPDVMVRLILGRR